MAGDRSSDALSTLGAGAEAIRDDLTRRGAAGPAIDLERALRFAEVVAALMIPDGAHLRAGGESFGPDRVVLGDAGARRAAASAFSLRNRSTDGQLPEGRLEEGIAPWIDLTAGGSGQAVGFAVGMALDTRLSGRPQRVIAILDSSECRAGIVWEALGAAHRLGLGRLLLIVAEDGPTAGSPDSQRLDSSVLAERFRAFGCQSTVVDSRDLRALLRARDDRGATSDGPIALIVRVGVGPQGRSPLRPEGGARS